MQPDTLLVVGLLFLVLSIPAIVSAWTDGRAPRGAAIVLVWGAGMILYAMRIKEGGYRWSDIPDAVYTVIGQVVF
ncbi:hypothetical protein [Tropicibacter naphthalenivorans]|uniref:Uncharacterized protein n=1 Tax=Tropicibacter naphthalenivorans TaxID=441103 RepID=A0A0P1GUN5_9RHOB|nr:hypothetical protein [Tropicibacter naphthalenivorans]CUH78272.1 hypothetical protein TRN7648_01888 [Tropicibacter naphthalenivorans]SMC78863.1 hypothetical protein SAMN04488093_10450 [Tropicibacter naphthalenivorans]